MGPGETESEGRSKKLEGEEQTHTERLLAALEEEVRLAVMDGTEDLVLSRLVEVTLRSIYSGRPLFDNPLKEPVFYARFFWPWVQSALDEQDALQGVHGQALKNLGLGRE
jgi:hypothetical protein